jgi:xylulokinase
MAENGAPIRRAVAVGGGAASRLWLQTVSDVAGITQLVPERTTGAAYGDAFLAGLATGTIEDARALEREWVRVVDEIEPDPDAAASYEELRPLFHRLYEETRATVHALGRLSLEDHDRAAERRPSEGGIEHVA